MTANSGHVSFSKTTVNVEMSVRADVRGAEPIPSDTRSASPFTPTAISVKYVRTGRRPWRLSRASLTNLDVGGLAGAASVWSHRPKQVAAAPQWVRDFIEANMPGEVTR